LEYIETTLGGFLCLAYQLRFVFKFSTCNYSVGLVDETNNCVGVDLEDWSRPRRCSHWEKQVVDRRHRAPCRCCRASSTWSPRLPASPLRHR